MTYTLKYPLKEKNEQGQEVELKDIIIHRMKVKHLKLIPKEIYEVREYKRKKSTINPDKLLPLIAALTGLTEKQLDEIDLVDLLPITDEVMAIVGEALDQTA